MSGKPPFQRRDVSSNAGSQRALSVVGIFAGIGGFEEGFRRKGHHAILLCESDAAARRVLQHHFPGTPIAPDVRELRSLPAADVVTAGFPCQDLSQVGLCNGISGAHSGLVKNVLELLSASHRPRWLVLENVPFMLKLKHGQAIRTVVEALEGMGWTWAYRTINTQAFGLPQRRRRVILLASQEVES